MSGGIKMGNNRFDLLSLGEILLRLSPPDNERIVSGETFQKQVGGAELNVVSGVSILGLRTGVVSKLPDNALGIYAKDKVRFCGVSDDFLVYDDSQDARLGIYYYENGAYPRKPGVVYDRRHTSIDKISLEELPKEMFQSTRCFHTSGITLALSENIEGVFEVVAESREEARQKVIRDCGMVMGGNVYSTLPDEEINWAFSSHPKVRTGRITVQDKQTE